MHSTLTLDYLVYAAHTTDDMTLVNVALIFQLAAVIDNPGGQGSLVPFAGTRQAV